MAWSAAEYGLGLFVGYGWRQPAADDGDAVAASRDSVLRLSL